MSGICPTPPGRSRNSFSDDVPVRDTYTILTPAALFNTCEGATNIDTTEDPRAGGSDITTEICCPAPGPAGPAGAAGVDGQGVPVGGTIGQHLTKIDTTDFNTEWSDHVSGTGGGTVTWRGFWQTGVSYDEDDFITHGNSSFMCVITHTSSSSDEPDIIFDANPGGTYWIVASEGPAAESKSLTEDLFDWVGDIKNWGMEDWGTLLNAGVGLYVAGTVLNSFFTDDGDGDGDADSVYNGDPAYTGISTPPSLQQIVSRICDRAGVTSYDVSSLPLTEVNFTIANTTSAINLLRMLSRVYFFDMVDSSGTLKFISRGSQTSVKTLNSTIDLGYVPSGSTPSAPIAMKRYQGIDLPKSISLEYTTETTAFNKFVQTATLETFTDGQNINVSVPITLDDQEAFNIVEAMIVNAHVERMNYSFTSTYKHMDLEPGDVITLPDVGDVRILRIDEKKDEGLLDFVCTSAEFSTDNYSASGLASSPPITYSDTAPIIGYSSGLAIELPPMDSTDQSQRLSLAPHGYGKAGWPGCSIYYSTDGGSSFTNFTSVTNEATWGRVASITPAPADHYVWDETTVVQVELKTGTLSSKTMDQVLNGDNWCIIGSEVIGFRNATLVTGMTYNISGLLRGRKGSEPDMDTHVIDEMFLLIDGTLVEFEYPLDLKDTVFQFKFVTMGSDISKATAISVQPSMRSRRPWQPAEFFAERNVGFNWNMNWVARNQYNGEMADSQTVKLPPDFSGYMIQILDPIDDDVIRSMTQVSNQYIYTQAQQIADFGSVRDVIKVRLNQTDQIAGPGYPLTKTFTI